MNLKFILQLLLKCQFININNSNLSRIQEKIMILDSSSLNKVNSYASPRPNELISSKSITRKPSFPNFGRTKLTEVCQMRSRDRIRFISPSKANLFITEEIIDTKNLFDFTYSQNTLNQPINYPFIKRCVSPKHFNDITCPHKPNINESFKEQNIFATTMLSPGIQDFGNCQQLAQDANSNERLQQQVTRLKKQTFQLNHLLDIKNQFIEKQKQQYDLKLVQLAEQLGQIKKVIQQSQRNLDQTEKKLDQSQKNVKYLQKKLQETNQKMDKATKQIKMYKGKYRINTNNLKEKQDLKSKNYHQNCGRGVQNHCRIPRNHQNSCNKMSNLKQPTKSTQRVLQLKKIKSQNILPTMCTSTQLSPQVSKLMKIHSNQQDFNQYKQLKSQIENLSKQIKYKDIQILTLKKAKCQYQNQKQNYDKVKKFNKKLLAKVQYLTKQFDDQQINTTRLSLPLQKTPDKKLKGKYQYFDDYEDQQVAFQLFDLSPEKYFHENRKQRNDFINEDLETYQMSKQDVIHVQNSSDLI